MYSILSLDVGTYEISQNFLTRYRLWALIDEIIKDDPDHTPLEDRTIDWLADRYLKRFRKRDRYRRHIFDVHNDVEVDLQGMTSKPRCLRHVPQSEVIGIFAAHADWLLAQHLISSSASLRKINISKWISFCRQVKMARREARCNQLRWGMPYGVDSDTEDEESYYLDLSRFGNTQEFWEQRINNALKKSRVKLVARVSVSLIQSCFLIFQFVPGPADTVTSDPRSHSQRSTPTADIHL